MQKPNIIKWFSEVIYVDIDTGEILPKHIAEREYLIIKKSKHYEFKNEIGRNGNKESYGIIRHHRECKKNGQQRLFE